jgi:hypothetical protein
LRVQQELAADFDPDEFTAFPGETVRERLVAALRYDLLGPEEPEEVMQQSPATRYLVGMLAPQGTPADPAEDDSMDTADDTGDGAEPPPAAAFSLTPSSIGMSFVVAPGTKSLVVTASWGEYEKQELTEEVVEPEEDTDIDREEDADETAEKKKRKRYEWVRRPHDLAESLDSAEGFGPLVEGRPRSVEIGEGVQLGRNVRRLGDNYVVSVFLVNARPAPAGRRPPDETWLYQPQLIVRGEGSPFLARSAGRTERDSDADVASADVIYRKRLEFATGHGVAASWDLDSSDPTRASTIRTEVIPEHEVPIVTPRGTEELEQLDMDQLASAEDGEHVRALISPLLSAYEAWIDDREGEVSRIPVPDNAVAAAHIQFARRCLARMRAGLQLLSDDSVALEAFRFANRAMALQRRHSVTVLGKRRGLEVPSPIEATWRPFQLGFILQCIEGIARPSHADRAIADLLWFPTGGGKTEAYLGLTAFTLAHRRLHADSESALDTSAGTAVLMRYTLRLLTIQQFQRATALLCACEVIRAEDVDRWGEARFTVGLWVGESVTPNRFDEAKENLAKLNREEPVYEGNPYQVLFCPWCGTDIQPNHYVADDDEERIRVKCWNDECHFYAGTSREGLPVLLVDEEIYRNPPSLLLATVDKFAQMAWNGRIQSLFGRVHRWCPRHGYLSTGDQHATTHPETVGSPRAVVQERNRWLAPPDLVIQDELHLISGPLGTLVGIYESAIDGLCSRKLDGSLVGAKVIASTATIRGAHAQIEALFGRKTQVFPPLGLDVADSFFAHEADDEPGRLYLGVFAPGKSIKTALVRVYAGLLSRAAVEFERLRDADAGSRATADAYMTLVGYFNSLRELGGAVRLVDDDVPARLRVLKRRGFGPARLIYEPKELTSRRQSSQISDILKQMDRTFLTREKGKYPIDVLLASNMISVGVDIDRLGLMVVSAQPKTSAEYIQATSRIGRLHPGLVVEVYNWVRPRDTSHYERFIHYHDTFYRHVEATSVTPFSARARDRALSAVLVSYARQADPRLSQEQDAMRFQPDDPGISEIVDRLVHRARSVTGRNVVGEETRQMLLNRLGEWEQLTADEAHPLRYSGRGMNQTQLDNWTVLLRSMEADATKGHWAAAGSLREVEPEIDVVLVDEGDGA